MTALLQTTTCGVCLANEKKGGKPDTSALRKAFANMIEWLHATGSFKIKDLKVPIVRQLISETSKIFSEAVDVTLKNVAPDPVLTKSLKQSGHVFSGFKTLHQVKQAEALLLDENGEIKPFERFLNDVRTIDETYNETYLHTEYKFAVASAQMADRWHKFAQDGDRYDLQYRTANDDRVRETHAELHNVTLPADSPFWDKYFPPNGWGCRCNVVQVRKRKYPTADLKDAMKKGDEATSGKFQKMFRFNPGKDKRLFPPHNPYTPSKCTGCSKSGFPLAKLPDNELCKACPLIRAMVKNKEEIRVRRKEIFKEARKTLQGTEIRNKELDKVIRISRNSIKEFLNQPHKYRKEKNEMLLDIKKVVERSTYLGISGHYLDDQNFESHIFETEIGGEKSWIIVREYEDKRVLLHGVSDSETVTKGVKKQPVSKPSR